MLQPNRSPILSNDHKQKSDALGLPAQTFLRKALENDLFLGPSAQVQRLIADEQQRQMLGTTARPSRPHSLPESTIPSRPEPTALNLGLVHTITEATKLLWHRAPGALVTSILESAKSTFFQLGYPAAIGLTVGMAMQGSRGAMALAAAGFGALAASDALAERYLRQRGTRAEKELLRLTRTLRSTVNESQDFETLDSGEYRKADQRFAQTAYSDLYQMANNSAEILASCVMIGTASLVIAYLDLRLAIVPLVIMATRALFEARESKRTSLLSRALEDGSRRDFARTNIYTEPHKMRDVRLYGHLGNLRDLTEASRAERERIEIGNANRLHNARLIFDGVLAATGVVAVHTLAAITSSTPMSIGLTATTLGILPQLFNRITRTIQLMGQLTSKHRRAAECLEFLASEKTDNMGSRMMFSSTPPALELTDVIVERGGRELLNVPNLRINPGECIGIIGIEGEGKSTLVKTILGLRRLNSGSVRLAYPQEDFDLAQCDISSWHQLVSVFNQDFTPYEGLTVRELLDFGIPVGRESEALSRAEALRLAEAEDIVDGPHGFDTVVGAGWPQGREFSGGQMKKIGLAIALRRNTPVLVLDEVTANISKMTAQRIIGNIREHAKKLGQTVIIISHNLQDLQIASRVLVVGEGRILEDGPVTQLMEHPDSVLRKFVLQELQVQADVFGVHSPVITMPPRPHLHDEPPSGVQAES